MGKYLDIARKFEAQRQAEGRTESQWGVSPVPLPKSQGTVSRPAKEPLPGYDDGREECGESLKPDTPTITKKRPFLPRPLGKEDAPDPWEVWTPLFDWLIEYHPEHFHAVCDAEDALNRMEREGITSRDEYEAACRDLLVKFETARRLKLKSGMKIWLQ